MIEAIVCAVEIWKLAGRVATSGFCVVVPDFIYGDPFVYDNYRPLAGWLKDMEQFDKGFTDAKLAIDALTDKGFSATPAAGFYWSAKVITKLAQSESIQAAVDSSVKISPKVAHGWAV
ncbi:putative alpha/Beta hydrolase [Rosa chinensis]|uniref:Putative alpha/Beta hydrolase n=1 Tax=Rosa chinensis TaxID=74649 RepID=A0A2P6PF58_ROSCH|nr:putative alpha/Beta hydrolase [Rosa chinensis]